MQWKMSVGAVLYLCVCGRSFICSHLHVVFGRYGQAPRNAGVYSISNTANTAETDVYLTRLQKYLLLILVSQTAACLPDSGISVNTKV